MNMDVLYAHIHNYASLFIAVIYLYILVYIYYHYLSLVYDKFLYFSLDFSCILFCDLILMYIFYIYAHNYEYLLIINLFLYIYGLAFLCNFSILNSKKCMYY